MKKKPSRFAPNIDARGRILRALGAAGLAAAALFSVGLSPVTSAVFAAGSLFLSLEAARGWCAVRACGIKTKI